MKNIDTTEINYTLQGMLDFFGAPSQYIVYLIEKLNANKLATRMPVIESENEEYRKQLVDFLEANNFLEQWNIGVKRASSYGYATFNLDRINDEWILMLSNSVIAPKRKGNGNYLEGGVLSPIIKGQKDLFIILSTLVLGILIALNSIKAEEPEIKLRGKFLLIAFISWTVGAIFDASVPLTFVTLPIVRILLISSAIEFYIGFVLPDWIKTRFLK